jgi:hypothetical protein
MGLPARFVAADWPTPPSRTLVGAETSPQTAPLNPKVRADRCAVSRAT